MVRNIDHRIGLTLENDLIMIPTNSTITSCHTVIEEDDEDQPSS